MYSLILDDTPGLSSRHESRLVLDEALARPLDPGEARDHDRALWGLDAEAVAAAETKDAIFGGVTYSEAA